MPDHSTLPPDHQQRNVLIGTIQDRSHLAGYAVARRAIEQGVRAANASASGTRVATTGSTGVLSLGSAGIPSSAALPAVLATGSPLSVFQYTLSRADKLSMYRYFASTDPFVGRAIELHSELPMSRLSIGPPKGASSKQNKEVNRIYESIVEELGLLPFLLDVNRDFWMVGDVFIWVEWDHKRLRPKETFILPAEYLHVIVHPFMRSREIIIYARPLVDTASIRRLSDRDLYMLAGDPDIQGLLEEADEQLPEGLKALLSYGEGFPLNTDPRKGSFVYHLSRNRFSNEPYGQSLIARCIETLLRLENLKNAQIQISGRNMSPKHLICADGIGQADLEHLRSDVDLSMLEPNDFPIVTSFPVTWQTIGAGERLLNVETEYSQCLKSLCTGLATTEEMLTGANTYSGQRFTMELMNSQYLLNRELIKKMVEEAYFIPTAEANGHYYYQNIDTWVKIDRDRVRSGDELVEEPTRQLRKRKVIVTKIYNHSVVRWNRISIRDSAEVYEQLFQLHQKGSLALRYLLDIHGIDSEENANALLEDVATNRDPTFNRILEGAYGVLAERLATETDLFDRIIAGLNLDLQSRALGQPGPGTPVDATQMAGGLNPMGTDTGMMPSGVGGLGGSLGGLGGSLGDIGDVGDAGMPSGENGPLGTEAPGGPAGPVLPAATPGGAGGTETAGAAPTAAPTAARRGPAFEETPGRVLSREEVHRIARQNRKRHQDQKSIEIKIRKRKGT